MAPLVLEGQTLGQKHRHFNDLVKASVTDQSWNLEHINHAESDVQNLLRIDVACSRRDITYILEVLKSKDLLYVIRVIKRSTWLIAEDQYAHIINPNYLEQSLLPSMTAKAKTKLLFAIRQNLKDENRVDAFFNFYKDDPKVAMKWLPGCSIATIEKFVREYPEKFSVNQIKRLCRKSFTILKIYCKEWNAYHKKEVLEKATNYIKSNCDEYLDIIDSIENYYKPKFNKNTTQFLMDNSRDRIIQNFEKYCFVLHLPTFARNLKSEQVQEFLLNLKQNKHNKLNYWFKFENIRHFMKYIPKDKRLEFIKTLFVEKDDTQNDELYDRDLQFENSICLMSARSCKKKKSLIVSNEHIYRWYRYAPFNTALTELKKLIHVESLPAERNAMFTVLIKCARSNQEQLKTLLEYYRNNHINEPFKFKIQFVNTFLSHTKIHEFDDDTWNILNNIFSSMEVYMESDNKVPFCINAIIVYKLLHDQPIPEIIEKKFTFSTLQDYRNKLDKNKQNKIFDYLYNHLIKILQNQKITNATLGTIIDMLSLLRDWKRNLVDYPYVISQIKNLIEMKRQKSWDIDLTELYDSVKRWRKHLFEISLVMHPSDEACLNALKHDPGLLSRYQKELEIMYSQDTVTIERTLKKVRIYWSESIAEQWTNYYLELMEQPKGQKAVKYVCTLIPCHRILSLIEQNAPVETKIKWNEASELKLILRKNYGKYMHLIRPSVSLDTVLLYAKGDYLYHTMPSLNAILYNLSSVSTSEYITKLIDAPVSLQKHGICAIFRKLKYNNIKDIVSNLWNNTKNSSIKTLLFRQTFVLLCKEKNESTIKDLWQLFEMYINSLTSEENANIYHIFTKFEDVHIKVRPLFFMKGYLYLKSLPPKANCENNIKTLFNEASSLIDLLEPSFVEDILLKSLADNYVIKKDVNLRNHFLILTSHILCCKSEETQLMRYEKLLLPILRKAFASWKLRHKGKYYIKIRSKQLLDAFISNITRLTAAKQNVIPVKLFKTIQDVLTDALIAEENYDILMNWELATLFVEAVDMFVKNNPDIYTEKEESKEESDQLAMPYSYNNDNNKIWEKICLNVSIPFGEACKDLLKKDIYFNQHPALYFCIKSVLMNLCSNLCFSDKNKLAFLKALLIDNDLATVYCTVIEAVRYLHCSSEDKPLKKEILKILRLNNSAEVNILLRYYETSDHSWDSEDEDNEKEHDENN